MSGGEESPPIAATRPDRPSTPSPQFGLRLRRIERRLAPVARDDGRNVGRSHGLAERLERRQDEIGPLELVDLVAGAHDRLDVHRHVVRPLAFDGELQLAVGRHQSRPECLERLPLFPDQPEFGRVPVEPGDHLVAARIDDVERRLPVGLHEVGEGRLAEDRHVAEEVVEHVGLDDVVELVHAPQPVGHRKAAAGEMLEKGRGRYQAGHGHEPPAGELVELVAHRVEVRHTLHQAERVDAPEIGTVRQALRQSRLTLGQRAPDGLVLLRIGRVVLLDGEVGPAARVVAAHALLGAFARIVPDGNRHGEPPSIDGDDTSPGRVDLTFPAFARQTLR